MQRRRRRYDDEPRCCCTAGARGQALVGPHEVLEAVNAAGGSVARRCETLPCPDHLEAIRRARRESEDPAALAGTITVRESCEGQVLRAWRWRALRSQASAPSARSTASNPT